MLKYLEQKLIEWVKNNVGLEPHNIIKRFNPTIPRYAASAINGNYGKTVNEMQDTKNQILYPWEKLDLVEDLKQIV